MEDRGLKISRKTTEYLPFNRQTIQGNVFLQTEKVCRKSEKVSKTEKFKYLGLLVTSDGQLMAELDMRVQAGWKNWKKVSRVFYDREINVELKGRVYKIAVWPAMLHDSER